MTPATTHTQYKKNFITKVIFRIDFPLVLVLQREPPQEFQGKIIDKFPILEPIEEFSIDTIAGKIQEPTKNIVWKFSNKDRSLSVDLSSQALILECNKDYKMFGDFKEMITIITTAFFDVYGSTVVTRLGLRYINEIVLNEKDFFNWKDYISKPLIENLEFIESKEQIIRVFGTTEISLKEGVFLKIRNGIFNSSYPSKVVKKEFVLDYDCYTKSVIEKEEIIKTATYFNDEITKYFEKSVTPKFRTLLNA